MNKSWRATQDTMNSIQIVGEGNKIVAELIADDDNVTDEMRANADLIIRSVNACIAINPDNPRAVAESIGDMHETLTFLRAKLGTGAMEDFMEAINNGQSKIKGALTKTARKGGA